jgi:hypothetical protein
VILSAGRHRWSSARGFFRSAHKLDITCPEPGMRLVTETELVDSAFKISWHSVGPEDWEVNITLSLCDQEADDLTSVYPEDVRRIS